MQVIVNFIKNAYEAIDEMEGGDIKKGDCRQNFCR